jgi:hypothetical protein
MGVPNGGSQIEVINWGPKLGSQIGVNRGESGSQKSGSQIGVQNRGPKLGSQIGVSNRGPKLGSQIGVLKVTKVKIPVDFHSSASCDAGKNQY